MTNGHNKKKRAGFRFFEAGMLYNVALQAAKALRQTTPVQVDNYRHLQALSSR